MSVQITLFPVWGEQSQEIATTKVRIQIALAGISAMLEQYDLLIETVVIVKDYRYPKTAIIATPEQKELDFTMTVVGAVKDASQIHVRSMGYWMQKEQGG